MRGKRTGWVLTAVFVLAGLFLGNRVGDALHAAVPAAAQYSDLAVKPGEIRLLDLAVTFGFGFRANLMGVLGGLAGIFLARRV